MAADELNSLLVAVRAWLWRQCFVAATRAALWGTAALLLTAVAWHLATRRVAADFVLWTTAALWTALLVRAALQRPNIATCALWADRHLHGQSAYGTLLEMQRAAPSGARALALHQLDVWAAAQAPRSRLLLSERREPTRLARPLLAALVCAALAVLVQSLWDDAGTPSQATAATRIDAPGDSAKTTLTTPPEPAQVADARDAAEVGEQAARRQAAAAAPPTRRARADAEAVFDPLAAADAASAASGAAARASAAAAAATDQATGMRSADAAGGRAAGDAVDDRAGLHGSRAGATLLQGQRPRHGARGQARWQADSDQPGTYDRSPPPAAAADTRPVEAIAAARPPAVHDDAAPLTLTEDHYVQTWIRALSRKP